MLIFFLSAIAPPSLSGSNDMVVMFFSFTILCLIMSFQVLANMYLLLYEKIIKKNVICINSCQKRKPCPMFLIEKINYEKF